MTPSWNYWVRLDPANYAPKAAAEVRQVQRLAMVAGASTAIGLGLLAWAWE